VRASVQQISGALLWRTSNQKFDAAYVVEVARCLAGLHDVSVEEMARITGENFNRFFGL